MNTCDGRSPITLRHWGVTVALSAVLAGCGGGQTHSAADMAGIDQLRQAYADAYSRRDAAAVAALYVDDAVELEGNGVIMKGRAALADMFAADTVNWGKITITPAGPATVFGDVAYESGTTAIEVTMGDKAITVPGSYLVVLRKEAGAWKLAAVAGVPDSSAVAALAPPARGKGK
jgi:uncharacterized protein (TIGR02246 family)